MIDNTAGNVQGFANLYRKTLNQIDPKRPMCNLKLAAIWDCVFSFLLEQCSGILLTQSILESFVTPNLIKIDLIFQVLHAIHCNHSLIDAISGVLTIDKIHENRSTIHSLLNLTDELNRNIEILTIVWMWRKRLIPCGPMRLFSR